MGDHGYEIARQCAAKFCPPSDNVIADAVAGRVNISADDVARQVAETLAYRLLGGGLDVAIVEAVAAKMSEADMTRAGLERELADEKAARIHATSAREDVERHLAQAYEAFGVTVLESEEGVRLPVLVERLRAELAAARKGLMAVEELIKQSSGVYGLHMNGDPAPWDELRTGGRFEGWMADLDRALNALPGQRAEG